MKDPRVEEPKVRTQEATSLYHPKSAKTSDRKTWKEKKKRLCRDQAQKGSVSTSVTGVNVSNPFVGVRRELGQVTCYNCREKRHYAWNCSEPQRNTSED